MASIPELMDGHITLDAECLDRLYLNGYIGRLATAGGLVLFMRDQLGKPILRRAGQITEEFREEVKALTDREQIPIHPLTHKEKKDHYCQPVSARTGHARWDCLHLSGAGENQGFNGRKINGQFQLDRDKTGYVNHYYFNIDDEDFGPFFIKVAATRLERSSSA